MARRVVDSGDQLTKRRGPVVQLVHPVQVRKHLRRLSRLSQQHARRFVTRRLMNLREARRAIIVWFSVVVLVIVAIALGSGIWTGANQVVSVAAGGTYTEGIVGTISTLNPLYASTAPEDALSRLMFSALYQYDATGTLTPDAASSTEVDASGTHYIVNLRHDIRWSDGQPLTAADVLYTINLIKNPASNIAPSLTSTWQSITVQQLGRYQIEFSLPTYANFMGALTFPILPAHILAKVSPAAVANSAFSSQPVSSGPFSFKLFQSVNSATGERAVYLVRNPYYYGPQPHLERFAVHAYPTTGDLVTALKLNEVTAAVGLDSATVKKSTPSGYVATDYTIDDGVFLILNTAQPDLQSTNVRKAIQLALSTTAIRAAAGGGVQPLDTPIISPTLQAQYHADPQNVTEAETLLAQAGWTQSSGQYRANKAGQTLELQFKTVQSPQFDRVIKVIRSELAAVGIKLDVTEFDPNNLSTNFVQSVLQPRDYDLLLYELTIGSDPDQFAYWHSSQRGINGYNFANYSDPIADAALSTARDTIDPALRQAKYAVFIQQWLKDVPAVGLYQQTVSDVHTTSSQSIDSTAHYVSPTDRYDNLASWAVHSASVYKTP